jgi:hypothetical protein
LKYRQSVGACCITLLMTACTREHLAAEVLPHAADAPRLIVRFTRKEQVWGDAELARLRAALTADIQPLAPISETAWVYGVRPKSGQSSEKLLNALLARPEVVYVEMDTRAHNP